MQDFSIVQPQLCLHKWRLAPLCCHGGFAVPFGKKGLLDAYNLSTLEGQTSKCRYDAEKNSVAKSLHAIYTLQVYHFKNLQEPFVYM